MRYKYRADLLGAQALSFRVSRVHEVSGSVAHRLSGSEERNEDVPSRPGVMVTGDPDEAFRGGIGRLAGPVFSNPSMSLEKRLSDDLESG